MPGSPFKKPFRGGLTKASPRRPAKPNNRKSMVPTPTALNGVNSRPVRQPTPPGVRVTTKARKSVPPPHVRQGTQLGTPGRHG